MKPQSWWEESPEGDNVTRAMVAEELKRNRVAFGLLSEVEQEVMRECELVWYTDKQWKDNHSDPADFPSLTYRVRADFVPEYAPEPEKPFDANYAPPGFVAVESNGSCAGCDAAGTRYCHYPHEYCSSKRPDGHHAILKRKSEPEKVCPKCGSPEHHNDCGTDSLPKGPEKPAKVPADWAPPGCVAVPDANGELCDRCVNLSDVCGNAVGARNWYCLGSYREGGVSVQYIAKPAALEPAKECGAVSPDGVHVCDLSCGHGGLHVDRISGEHWSKSPEPQPAPEWGEWQEYQTAADGSDGMKHNIIRFRKAN